MKVSAMLLAASAQEKAPTPAPELGFSHSYTRVNPGGAISSTNANGGYGYAEYNVNRVFGMVGRTRCQLHRHRGQHLAREYKVPLSVWTSVQ